MAEYSSWMDNAATNFEGFSRWMTKLFKPGVATGWTVSQRAAGANMSVDIAVGDGAPMATNTVAWSWTNAVKNVSIGAASANNRRDIVVAYTDMSVTAPSTATPNNPNALKFMVVAGTPATSPADPSDGTIQAAVGSSNPFLKLARVSLTSSTTQITNAQITSLISGMALNVQRLWGGSNSTLGHLVPNVADGILITSGDTNSVSAQMLATNAITLGRGSSNTNHNTGATTSYIDISGMAITVSVPTGGRTLKVTAYVSTVYNGSGTGTNTRLAIREGSTVLADAEIALPNNDQRRMGAVIYSAVVTGTHTYKMSTQNAIATNVQYNMSSTSQGYLLAELL